MKKGCFVKLIVILTIVTATVLYIVQNKFNDFIYKPGMRIFKSNVINQINNRIGYVKASPEKDSLESMVKGYFDNIDNIKNLKRDSISPFIRLIVDSCKDSVITENELKSISQFLKVKLKYERPKKN